MSPSRRAESTSPTVRPATLSDLDALADLWVELVADQRDHGAHLLAAENRETARDFLGQYVAADNAFVAERDGAVVGFANGHLETGVYEQDVDRGLVDNVYVRPDYRDEGLGSSLLDAVEDALRADGAEVLAVSALAANDDARRLYRERGYSPHRVTLERPAESDTHSNRDGE